MAKNQIEVTIYDAPAMLGTFNRLPVVPSYFTDTFFPGVFLSDNNLIDVSAIPGNERILAPLVAPLEQGRPIYDRNERLTRVKPSYMKPKDSVDPDRVITRQAGIGDIFSNVPMTAKARYQAIVADIMLFHKNAIFTTLEMMAAQIVSTGKCVILNDGLPESVVDFGRDADHDAILADGATWDVSTVDKISTIEAMSEIVTGSDMGSQITRITMGSKAWSLFRADPAVRQLMELNMAQFTGMTANMGGSNGARVRRMGFYAPGVEIWVNSDYYTDPVTKKRRYFVDPRDVILTGDIMGVKAFGVIQDAEANFAPMPVFPKMWISKDPGVAWVMTQAAALPIPVAPNASARIRVTNNL